MVTIAISTCPTAWRLFVVYVRTIDYDRWKIDPWDTLQFHFNMYNGMIIKNLGVVYLEFADDDNYLLFLLRWS